MPYSTRCDRCHGTGAGGACKRCLGFGWMWSDGRPPTMCPGGGMAPNVSTPKTLPCGRDNDTCPGCDRSTDIIGLDEDVKRTVEVRNAKVR